MVYHSGTAKYLFAQGSTVLKQRTYEGIKFLLDVIAVALIVVLIGLWIKPAKAGDKIIQDTEVSQSVNVSNTSDAFAANDNIQNVAGDTNKSDNLALGLSHGLGGAEIADCLATTANANILFSRQGTKLNKWCAAEAYDAKGLHKMAAQLRCQIPAIKEIFTGVEGFSLSACVEANTVQPVKDDSLKQITENFNRQLEIKEDEHDRLTADLSERIANLEEEAEKARKRAERPQAKPQTIIREEKLISDEERAKLESYRVSK